ncbi:MAG TPA: mannitol dehydrogenase family protein [Hyphomicrobiales bacterium]|nr:mannitol dehydrogenase family protein [Hyphomicrobiales bacterium]
MMAGKRLGSIHDVEGDVAVPAYDPAAYGNGIVHLGVGAFHRAHQAVYTDEAIGQKGGNWRIIGVSLRATDIADALNPQNGFYTVLERDASGTRGRLIGSISRIIAAARDRHASLAALADPDVRVVTLTVTEKAYGIDRTAMQVDLDHPAVARDLAAPHTPTGVLGLLTQSLRLRRQAGAPPYTVLCCDNLPDNGALLRAGVFDFARRIDPGLADWIGAQVAFPSSMVDRITPASTDATLADARRLTGCVDLAAVETEPFSQWVIEDLFTAGRPAWESAGALFVSDVKPYEAMKLRMLNGAHSMLAYAGFLSSCKYVRDVMAHPGLRALVERHLQAAASTLPVLQGIDFNVYAHDLINRFANPAIGHETYQIAMDGTEKLPQRILSPAIEAMREGQDIRPFAFAVACWMRYCLGRTDSGETYALRDPREAEIRACLESASTADAITARLHNLPDLFDQRLVSSNLWCSGVSERLETMLRSGIAAAISTETSACK